MIDNGFLALETFRWILYYREQQQSMGIEFPPEELCQGT